MLPDSLGLFQDLRLEKASRRAINCLLYDSCKSPIPTDKSHNSTVSARCRRYTGIQTPLRYLHHRLIYFQNLQTCYPSFCPEIAKLTTYGQGLGAQMCFVGHVQSFKNCLALQRDAGDKCSLQKSERDTLLSLGIQECEEGGEQLSPLFSPNSLLQYLEPLRSFIGSQFVNFYSQNHLSSETKIVKSFLAVVLGKKKTRWIIIKK